VRIVEELQKCVFEKNSNFLKELAKRWYNLRVERQRAFFDLLAEEIREKLQNYRMIISLRFHRIIVPSCKRPEELFGKTQEIIRKTICDRGYYNQVCESERCFEGAHCKGVEIDALVIHKGDLCLIEYEDSRKGLCYDFMKIYWMRQFFNREFESLFVTRLTTRRHEDTFAQFNKYVDSAKPILDSFLGTWKILEIVDLYSEKNRTFRFQPLENASNISRRHAA